MSGVQHNHEISPTELLGSAALSSFLVWAKREFDFILIDTPPTGIFSDALILARAADATVLICRCDQSRRSHVRRGLSELDKCGAKLAGIVLTDLRPRSMEGRFGYGSDLGYNYSHYKYYREYSRNPTDTVKQPKEHRS